MASAKTGNVQIVEKNEGTKISLKQKDYKLIFGDDDLSIRCDTRQKEYPVHIDIFADEDGNLTMGKGRDYVAQIDIPAYSYPDATEESGELGEGGGGSPEPLPLDMTLVVVTLWSVDGIMEI